MRALVLVAFCACLEPTEITLVLTTDVPCDQIKQFSILMNGSPISTSSGCSGGTGQLGSLVLVPSSNPAREGTIAAELELVNGDCLANPPSNCIVARRSLQFVSHTALTVPIQLASSCIGVQCLDGMTCVNGMCASSK